jgi:hypothetical protein
MGLKFKPYSFSKIDTYQKCPYKFKLRYIDNIWPKNVDKFHTIRGTYMHNRLQYWGDSSISISTDGLTAENITECERKLNSFSLSDLGKDMMFGGTLLKNELNIGIGLDWTPQPYKSKENLLYKGKIDKISLFQNTLRVIDWKAGKVRQQSIQLLSYALWAFLKWPQIKRIESSYIFLDHIQKHTEIYHRENIPHMKKSLLMGIKPIEKAPFYKKNPTGLCEYCEYGPQATKHCIV